VAWAILVLMAAPSCGGEEFTSGTGGTGATGSGGLGGSGTGGSGGGPPGACPATQPAAGTPCQEDLLCTYGDDARPNCRVHVRCVSSAWSIVREPNCPLTLPCAAATVTGTQCLTSGDECADPNGYCACTCTPGCSSYTWKCPSPGPGCPPIAPNAGTGCGAEGATCSYGVCDDTTPLHDQVIVQCQNGSWAWIDTSCLS
jgi:hypothetical protein